MQCCDPYKESVVMTRDEARAFDSWAINTIGIPGAVLMENAGRRCAKLIKEKLDSVENPKVCIFCGTGNNGGDGFVIARHLRNYGFDIVLVICGTRDKIKGDALVNLNILDQLGQKIEYLNITKPDVAHKIKTFAADANMLVDAIFGTGLQGQISENYISLIESINALNIPILAVDIPSGLDCDTGHPLGAGINAAYTVTFSALKKGFLTRIALEYTGQIHIASIGVEPFEMK